MPIEMSQKGMLKMRPLNERIKIQSCDGLARVKRGADKAFCGRSVRLSLSAMLMLTVLVPLAIFISTVYVAVLLEEIGGLGIIMLGVIVLIIVACPVVAHMLLLGTAYGATRAYRGEGVRMSDLFFAFRSPRRARFILHSTVASLMLAACVVIVALTADVFVTIDTLVELYGVGFSIGVWVLGIIVLAAEVLLLARAMLAFAIVPFLMVTYPQEKYKVILKSARAVATADASAAGRLVLGAITRLALSALLVFVPWVIVTGPTDIVYLAGYTVETLNDILMPDDSVLFPNGIPERADINNG